MGNNLSFFKQKRTKSPSRTSSTDQQPAAAPLDNLNNVLGNPSLYDEALQTARAALNTRCENWFDFKHAEIALAVYQTLLNFFGEADYHDQLVFEIFQHIKELDFEVEDLTIVNMILPFCTPEQQHRIQTAFIALQIKSDEWINHPDCRLISYLGKNDRPRIGILRIAKLMTSEGCQLSMLDFSENRIIDTGAIALANALTSENCRPTALNLNHNFVGDEGASALADALTSENCRLKTLSLYNNRIGDAGASALANALQSNNCQQLKTLSLGDNKIGDAGAIALADALTSNNCQLETLSLAQNRSIISSAGKQALARAAVWAELDGRSITIEGIDSFFDALKEAVREDVTAAWQEAHQAEQADANEDSDNEEAQDNGGVGPAL